MKMSKCEACGHVQSSLVKEDVDNPYYFVKDIATLLGRTEAHVRILFRNGEFPNAKNPGGKGWMARRSDVLVYINRIYGD
jgi:hypothetical protein